MKAKTAITLMGIFISIIVLTLISTTGDSFALSRDRRYAAPPQRHNESVTVRQHERHAPGRIVTRSSFNRGGDHYRPHRSGYYGSRVRPVYRSPYHYGYSRPWPRTSAYISLGGIFYQSPPAGYVVVTTPPETVVIRETYTIPEPYKSATGYVMVTVSTLNVHTGPDLGYSLMGQVKEGTVLELYGVTDDWSYVKLPDGRLGWVTSVFTEPMEPARG